MFAINEERFPRSALTIYWFIVFSYVVASRIGMRNFLRKQSANQYCAAEVVAIYGASEAGARWPRPCAAARSTARLLLRRQARPERAQRRRPAGLPYRPPGRDRAGDVDPLDRAGPALGVAGAPARHHAAPGPGRRQHQDPEPPGRSGRRQGHAARNHPRTEVRRPARPPAGAAARRPVRPLRARQDRARHRRRRLHRQRAVPPDRHRVAEPPAPARPLRIRPVHDPTGTGTRFPDIPIEAHLGSVCNADLVERILRDGKSTPSTTPPPTNTCRWSRPTSSKACATTWSAPR
jgi:hypothetical protein